MAVRASLVLAVAVLLRCSEAARLDMLALHGSKLTLHGYKPDEKLVACQRRDGRHDVWSWFEPDTGGGVNVHDGEELVYKGEVDGKYIHVTWKGVPGQIRKDNTKAAAESCKPLTPTYEPDKQIVACQRRDDAEAVWSWFEPDNGGGMDVHDGEELVYKGEVDGRYIYVTWKGVLGKIVRDNTKAAEQGCEQKTTSTTSTTTQPTSKTTSKAASTTSTTSTTAGGQTPANPKNTGTTSSTTTTSHPSGPTGDQLPLVVAHYHGDGWKSRFTPKDKHVKPPDWGISDGQVMQCLDKPCQLNNNWKPVSVLFRGVEGTVEGRNLVLGTKADYDDFYNPDILMGPCGARLARPSQEKMDLVKKLFTIHDPRTLGKGADVQDGRPSDYSSLQIRSVWEVLDQSPKIEAYKQRIAALNEKHGDQDFHLNTVYDEPSLFPPSGLNTPSREKGWLEENEYWFVRGADPKYSEDLVCKGGAYATQGMFGHGVYLADAADKMDQYVSPVDKGAVGLEWALNSNKDPLVEAAAESGTKSVGMEPKDVYVGQVMRAYMGHHVELQEQRGRSIFWRDTAKSGEGRDLTTRTGVFQPPFEGTEFDSMKVVCADSYHENTHPGCEKRGGHFPYRWNEYVVPGTDGFDPQGKNSISFAENAVLKFLVVYDRV